MKRRQFIQTSSIMTLPILLKGMEVTAIEKSGFFENLSSDNDRVLVLVQLNGGNDGLNTLIPLDQFDKLMNVRTDIMIPESKLLKLDDLHALHPMMGGFRTLHDAGKLATIQSVAYPNQNRSHFRSTDIWTTASDAEDFISTGWIGRFFDTDHPTFPENYPNSEHPDPFAITLGFVVSDTCQGQSTNFSFALNDPNTLTQLDQTEEGDSQGNPCYRNELQFIQTIIRQSNAYSETVGAAYEKGNNLAVYPEDNDLARQLKIVARLVSGGLKTKIYVVSLGGFDTHANQTAFDDPTQGAHSNLLGFLSSAVQSFQEDLEKLGVEKKVVGMTFSEFGRRIKANGSGGTDHGTAAPLFLFGSCINPGFFGENPQIGDQVGDDEGVAMQFDFRSVYASILMDWFGATEEQVRATLFRDFQKLPIIQGCDLNTSIQEEVLIEDASLLPNLVQNSAMLKFEGSAGQCLIQILNASGGLIRTLMSRSITSGTHTIQIETDYLEAGIYFLRLVNNNRHRTLRFVKTN